jgi:hypothetical protein
MCNDAGAHQITKGSQACEVMRIQLRQILDSLELDSSSNQSNAATSLLTFFWQRVWIEILIRFVQLCSKLFFK